MAGPRGAVRGLVALLGAATCMADCVVNTSDTRAEICDYVRAEDECAGEGW
jgi:hypothetical protein